MGRVVSSLHLHSDTAHARSTLTHRVGEVRIDSVAENEETHTLQPRQLKRIEDDVEALMSYDCAENGNGERLSVPLSLAAITRTEHRWIRELCEPFGGCTEVFEVASDERGRADQPLCHFQH